MSIDTTCRIHATETMDDFSLEGRDLREALDKIASINRFLGGNNVTVKGVEILIADIPANKEITVVDIGCGNGDMLRTLANYALKTNRKFKLIGVDANQFTANYARALSQAFPNIRVECLDVFAPEFAELDYDIALCTLTLHHFEESRIFQLLDVLKNRARTGIVINDLDRSRLAYRLFQVLAFVCGLNKMSREDGLVSILRGFKKNELAQFSRKMAFKNVLIKWKWAFRYQWIIRL